MRGNTAFLRFIRPSTLGLVFSASALPLLGMAANIAGLEAHSARTNWFDRWLTNSVEVRMPLNHFVDEYHTNFFTVYRTNSVVVDAFRTNYITAYRTNSVLVDAFQTNFVTAHRTNWATLNLTNWETVLLFKTNWIALPVTNVVQIDLPVPAAPAVAVAPVVAAPIVVTGPRAVSLEPASPAPAPAWSGLYAIDAVRSAQPVANNLVEVHLKVRRTDNASAPLQVQRWRVEREDAAILLFGQDPEFKRQLPVGKYKIEARLKPQGDQPSLAVRGTLSVTAREALVQERLLVKR